MSTIRFKVRVETWCSKSGILEIDEDDLRDIPEDEQVDYVWKHLGGDEAAHDLVETGCFRIDRGLK